jgi:large subunit ribosomal protein L19
MLHLCHHMRQARALSLLTNAGAGLVTRLVETLPAQLTSLQNFTAPRGLHTSWATSLAQQPTEALDSVAPSLSAAVQPQGPRAPAWTPTNELIKRKTLTKRMGHLLSVLEKEKEKAAAQERNFPDFKAGDVLEVKLSIPENKRRTTTFKGLCIAKFNKGWRTSFTVRNFIGSSGGLERTFPL